MSATNQKNIFIDTEQYHSVDNKVTLLFPSQTLVVPQGFGMKLSLQQFTMKKSFYNINKYNNTFYLYNSTTNAYTEIVIAEGDYYKFGRSGSEAESLCKAIQDAITNAGIGANTVTYNVNTKKLSIQSASFSATNYLVCFQVPPSRQNFIPANTSPNGLFSDVAEILGARSNQAELLGLVPFPAFELDTTTFTSFYPASLYSMENIRLLINLGSSNLETPNMDANSSTSICLASQTFATIPLQDGGSFDGLNLIEPAMIMFQDDGDELFSIKLQQNHIDSCKFSLVDGKGRPIDEVGKDQYKNGEMNYQMVIRYEIIEEPFVANPSNLPSSNRSGNLLPSLR
jgi:hypothetical protein